MPRSGTAGSYCSFILSFLKNLYIVLYRGCINLHSPATVQADSLFSTSSPVFTVCTFFKSWPFWLIGGYTPL